MKHNVILLMGAAMLLALAGCNGCNKNKSRQKPDVTNVKTTHQWMRFDEDFMQFKQQPFDAHYQTLQQQYGDFLPFYISRFVAGPQTKPDEYPAAVLEFVKDAYINRSQDSIRKYYPSLDDVKAEFDQSLKYFTYYFPEVSIKRVYTLNSGYYIGAFTYADTVLGIGLDMYLGNNNPDYDSIGVYQYLRHKMNRHYITRNAMEVVYNNYFDKGFQREQTLLDAMLQKGIKMYVLSHLLPDAPDSLILGYTQAQTTWCEKNEYNIWQFINDKDILYKDNYMDKKRYLDEGPATPGMPAEAPGNIGSWVGLQIVRSYVNNQPETTLQQLTGFSDMRAFFNASRYRPKK